MRSRALTLALAVPMALGIAQAATAAAEIIMDNPEAVLVGSWTTGTSAPTRYGPDYYYCSLSESNGKTTTYTPVIPATANDWEVYTWYPMGSNRPTAAEYIIHSATGDDYKYVNQQVNGGMWNYLGTYTMNAGTASYVRITNYGSEAKVVMADATRFYSASASEDTTPPVISEVQASPGYTSATVTWTTDEPATSQVEYGLTTSYGGQTTKDTALVTSHSVILASLTPNTLYHFRVKSEDANSNLAVSGDYTFTTLAEAPPEFRTIWVDTWGNGFLSAAEVTELVSTLETNNYNAVIPEVRKRGDAYYDSSPIYCPACGSYHQEPRASNIIDPPPWDPLGDAITKAHAQGIEVHPWIVVYKIWTTGFGTPPSNHVWAQHPEWALTDNAGGILEGTNYALDSGIPAVQDYICKVVLDIVGNYDVDGLNLDYIRYPGTAWGYNAITEQRFYDEYGFWPPTSSSDPNWGDWCDYRRQQVTDLVKKCYLEIMAIKPHVKLSACLTSWGGLYPSYDFTNTDTYKTVFQNWPVWAQGHFIDVLMPMDYKREHVAEQARDYRDWIDFAVANRNGRHSYNGQGSYLNTIANSMIQMQAVKDHGADGISNYSYRSTNNEGLPNSDFYDAVRTTHYTSPVPTPDMPWKSDPTTGIIFGTVTDASEPHDPIYLNWVYKAEVTISGPVSDSTVTDATGTYGFLDLPDGIYTITCSKSGFPTRTYQNQALSAGQVLREDFELGYTTASSPPGAVTANWNLLSLPLEPTNPDPAVVFSGIDIDAKLYRWDKPTQSIVIYDVWNPPEFGDVTVDEGYWLQNLSGSDVSYQAYAGTPATNDISLPKAGWSIIGCPFMDDRQWADALVSNGIQTVSVETARANGWLNSLGQWWESSTQSLKTVGLPDDWPDSEALQPWHGYWIQTYVDGLILILQ